MKLSIWSCDSPDFLIMPDIRIFGTGADTLNSVQASYFERFHWPILNFWTPQTVEYDCNGTRNNMLLGIVGNPRLIPIRSVGYRRDHGERGTYRNQPWVTDDASAVCSVQKFKIDQ